jgi:type IV secretory pathway TraG/TraD family ATPase VirD4
MLDAFNHAVAAILDCETLSMLGLQRMLTDQPYREWVVRQIKDPFVRHFWRNFETKDRKTKAEVLSPILNKLNPFLMSPLLRNILGQSKSRIDARYMMDNRKIFIANLSKGLIGDENANLLGALLISQFRMAAMSRADIPQKERKDFYLYVDEFQSFGTDAFASILSETRKYGLSIVLANQHMAQIEGEIINAVLGNVGSIIAFRVGSKDAEVLESEFGRAYSASQFTGLNNGEVCAKLLSNGREENPFIGQTYAPRESRKDRSSTVISRSRSKYSRKREWVERRLNGWFKKLEDRGR